MLSLHIYFAGRIVENRSRMATEMTKYFLYDSVSPISFWERKMGDADWRQAVAALQG